MSQLSVAIKNSLKGKSKTVNFNAAVTALIGLSAAMGFPVPEAIVPVIYMGLNWIMRLITTKPLDEK